MAGRPKKKPEYNPELQFNNFLQELRDAYEAADSLRTLADELNISLLKLRKLLITADVFISDICTEINDLYQSGKKIPEIMKLTGLSRASVHSYLPYTKGLYNAAEIKRLTGLCVERGIRTNKLATLSGITQSTLNSMMRGETKNPKLKTLRKIAMGFNMTVSELLDFPEMNEMEFEDE